MFLTLALMLTSCTTSTQGNKDYCRLYRVVMFDRLDKLTDSTKRNVLYNNILHEELCDENK